MRAMAIGLSVLLMQSAARAATPEEVGSIDSAEAFVSACRDAANPPSEAANEVTPEGEPTAGRIALALIDHHCQAVVTAVARTIMQMPEYKIGDKRICIDPATTSQEVLEDVFELWERPAVKAESEVMPTDLVIIALAERSRCT